MASRASTAGLCAVVAAALCAPAAAQTNDFYRGKTLSIVINYTSGGPTDTEARLIARHLPKHLPGVSGVIVRNMGGAGGLIGVNWLGEVAPRDGTTIGYMTGIVGAAMDSNPALKTDATKLPFIAGVEGMTIYYARTDIGVSKPADIMTKSGFWMGGLTPDNHKDLRLRSELDLLGISYRYVSGYTGAAEARLALERGEVQFTAESLPSYRTQIEPALVKTGKVIPMWYDTSAAAGEKGSHPDAEGIDALPYETFYRQMKGEPPKNDLWRMTMLMKEIASAFQRTVNAPPGSPPEAVEALRRAFATLATDEEFRADALRTIKFVPRFPVGAAVEKTYFDSMRIDDGLKRFIHDYAARGMALVGK